MAMLNQAIKDALQGYTARIPAAPATTLDPDANRHGAAGAGGYAFNFYRTSRASALPERFSLAGVSRGELHELALRGHPQFAVGARSRKGRRWIF